MSKREEYILGSGLAPEWCRKYLMHYIGYDGSIRYEFHGHDMDFDLRKGDRIIRRDGRIEIKRKVRNE